MVAFIATLKIIFKWPFYIIIITLLVNTSNTSFLNIFIYLLYIWNKYYKVFNC